MQLYNWAAKWGVPIEALNELEQMVTSAVEVQGHEKDYRVGRESNNQKLTVIDAAKSRCILWRNNVGAFQDDNGNFVRFGLGNETEEQNKVSKSSDLIGIRKVVIQPEHVGRTFGLFVAREMKKSSWTFTGTDREIAQRNFINLVQTMGGDAAFCNHGRFLTNW